jgi:2-iminobutanoate/2-iminopropanoate deaminase
MDRKVVATDKAPGAVGPYSQGIVAGDFVYASGMLGLDPGTGELVGEDVATQTRQALKNIQSILEAGGSSMERAVKLTVFLTDIGDFAEMNTVYAEFFPSDAPARATVQIGPLPKGALVEIDAVGVR